MKPPAFQWYGKEWLSDARRYEMGLAQRGAFLDLLSYQWVNGSVPDDLPSLARVLGVPPDEIEQVWCGSLRTAFSIGSDGRLRNPRLESYRTELDELQRQRREAGARSAAARTGTMCVYAARRRSDGAIKIGLSADPQKRANHLRLELLSFGSGDFSLERRSQVELSDYRIGTEWFSDCQEVREWIARELNGRATVVSTGTTASPQRGHGPAPAPAPASEVVTTPRKRGAKAVPVESWSAKAIDTWQQCAGQPPVGPLVSALKPIYDTLRDTDRLCYGLAKWLRAGNAKFGPAVFARDWRKWVPNGTDGLPSQTDLAVAEFLAKGDDAH